MSDRELLELAAKASGYTTSHQWNRDRLEMTPPVLALIVHKEGQLVTTGWNPLEDDGHALRLASSLKINILHMSHLCPNYWIEAGIENGWLAQERVSDSDIHTATRRAIVRAAAEICKATERILQDEFHTAGANHDEPTSTP